MARSRARARLNFSSQGQRCGRCRVSRRAERVSRPAQGEEPPPEGLGGHDLLTQADAGCPAGQVVRHHLYRQPGAVGGEAARGEMAQPTPSMFNTISSAPATSTWDSSTTSIK